MMEVASVGVRTRARTLALATAAGKRNTAVAGELRTRRTQENSKSGREAENSGRISADRCPSPDQIALSRCSSSGSSELAKERLRSADPEVEFKLGSVLDEFHTKLSFIYGISVSTPLMAFFSFCFLSPGVGKRDRFRLQGQVAGLASSFRYAIFVNSFFSFPSHSIFFSFSFLIRSFEFRRRETTPSSHLRFESDDLESTERPFETNSCRRSTAEKLPSSEEIEAFFSAFEKDEERRFAEK